MDDRENLQARVAERLRSYLQAHELRQTRERFAILEAIYDTVGTFTAEDLRETMRERRFHVSMATIYATTRLLVEANLLLRHPFISASAVFERVEDDKPRAYQVCGHCGRVALIRNKPLNAALAGYRPPRFSTTHRVAYMYGICVRCQKLMKKKLNK